MNNGFFQDLIQKIFASDLLCSILLRGEDDGPHLLEMKLSFGV
jgi:hypothetical protein